MIAQTKDDPTLGLMISEYLTDIGTDLNFKSLENIMQYPQRRFFNQLDCNVDNIYSLSENWIPSQIKINKDKKNKILKTHNIMCSIKNRAFTNGENTKGVIYVVRDPRNVVTSILNHFLKKNINDAFNFISDPNKIIGRNFSNINQKISKDNEIITLISSWSNHYNSWKNYNSIKSIIIKYEDLIRNTADNFYEIVLYLNKLYGTKVDEKKILKSIELTNFKNLQNLEKEHGFEEITISKTFFREGKIGSWKKKLDEKLSKKIENEFKNEMIELGYL